MNVRIVSLLIFACLLKATVHCEESESGSESKTEASKESTTQSGETAKTQDGEQSPKSKSKNKKEECLKYYNESVNDKTITGEKLCSKSKKCLAADNDGKLTNHCVCYYGKNKCHCSKFESKCDHRCGYCPSELDCKKGKCVEKSFFEKGANTLTDALGTFFGG